MSLEVCWRGEVVNMTNAIVYYADVHPNSKRDKKFHVVYDCIVRRHLK